MTMTQLTLADVRTLDQSDPLRGFRDRFALPEGVIYLDGNSLGALPKSASQRLASIVMEQWGQSLIRSWNDHDWIGAPQRVGGKIAALIGAQPEEVIVADSTSVNLFKLLIAATRLKPDRSDIVTEAGNFPTDLHIARSVAELMGKRLVTVHADELMNAIGHQTACVVLSHVHYRSARRHDMKAITASAAKAGTRVIWDLSHSAGAVPLNLNADSIEFAVGCGYKYLNGGPGAPAFLYAAKPLLAQLSSPIPGWMGHAAPFDFEDEYRPAPGIDRFLAGTPPILSLLALEAGVDLMLEADRSAVFDKSRRLFDLFAACVASRCPELQLVSPSDAELRGSHIAFAHPQASSIMNALIARGVIGDYRAPNILRFGLTPLYLGYEDIWNAIDALENILQTSAWRDPRFAQLGRVT